MFGLVALEVLIGLVLVYLLLSLVCSTIQEAIAAWLNWRGRMLRRAVQQLLAADSALAHKIYRHELVQALKNGEREPSYIPNRTFAEALVGILTPSDAAKRVRTADDRLTALLRVIESGAALGVTLPPSLQSSLATLLENARDKLAAESAPENAPENANAPKSADADAARALEAFKQEIETWFERTMNRASGWYRRKSQFSQFVLATLVAAATNADTLMITEQLANDPQARAVAVQAAVELVNSPPPGVEAQSAPDVADTTTPTDEADAKKRYFEARKHAEDAVGRFEELAGRAQLRVGWPDPRWRDERSAEAQLPRGQRWARKILGLLITICAVALGAPFWFQMLEKIVKLRGSGARAKGEEPAAADKSEG